MLRAAMTSAIAYWERARIVYNLVLALVVLGHFAAAWPGSWRRVTLDLGQVVFLLAVLANVAFCAAYPVDIFAQLSGFRAVWLKVRGLLLVVGIAFAAILTRFISLGLFFEGF
jgi:hypothetical protein